MPYPQFCVILHASASPSFLLLTAARLAVFACLSTGERHDSP